MDQDFETPAFCPGCSSRELREVPEDSDDDQRVYECADGAVYTSGCGTRFAILSRVPSEDE